METDVLKGLVQTEVLDLLNENIDNEISAMKDSYTVAEISKEVLLSFDTKTFS